MNHKIQELQDEVILQMIDFGNKFLLFANGHNPIIQPVINFEI